MAKSKGRRLAEFLRRLNASGRVEDASDIFDTSASLTTSSALSSGTISNADDDDTKLATNAAVIDHVDSKLTALGLQDLSNTAFTGLTSGHVLSYNGTNWVNSNDFIGLTDLSVGTPNSASGSGAISYSNSTGEFKYTPPDLSSYLTSVPAQSFASLTGKPTTISGYGITDAFDGAYSSLTGTPTIPTNNNQLTNGAGYITSAFINDKGSAASLDLNNLTASTDEGYYSWASTQPTNGPGWTYGGLLVLRDQNQNNQIAFGGSTSKMAIRRANSGSYGSWAEVWTTNNLTATNKSNYDTAYGWGNHASAGYLTTSGVDSHLNTSTATSNQVLAWTGSDYDWVAQSGGWSGGTLSANILLNTTGSATSSTSYPSYSLILRGQGWDTNGSYASNVDWYIRNETIASVYPDSDLVFYEQDPSYGHYKVKFHGRGSGGNYLDQAAASFYGDVYINQTVDSTGGTLTVGNIPEIGSDWNPVVLEDSGVIKKDSGVTVHGSGYLRAAYLNMTHGASGSTSDTVFYSSGDSYIRKNTAGGFVGSLLNATSNPSLTTTHDVNFRNYVYNSTGGTPTRGGFGYHVYQCWSQNLSLNVTDSSWVRGDIIEFNNVRGAVNITVTGSRIYMPNGSHDTVVTWNGTKGGFKLMKYSSNTGYWMVAL